MPDAHIELTYHAPLELLIAVILSAQCTDKRVNLVTPALFKRYPSAQDYAEADLSELSMLIRTCGLYRSKAKNIRSAAQVLTLEYGGKVPTSVAALNSLPGVGRKTAGVVSNHLGGDPAFPVDTHVKRVAYRLALTSKTDPSKVELDLQRLLPSHRWMKAHQLFVWHGRRTCFARSPACTECVVSSLCPKQGVKVPKRGTRRRAQSSDASSAS